VVVAAGFVGHPCRKLVRLVVEKLDQVLVRCQRVPREWSESFHEIWNESGGGVRVQRRMHQMVLSCRGETTWFCVDAIELREARAGEARAGELS
jgi:hypothetical protein